MGDILEVDCDVLVEFFLCRWEVLMLVDVGFFMGVCCRMVGLCWEEVV